MDVLRLAAFSDGSVGGNPAGVMIADALPDADTMQSVAADVGYSETAFAAPDGEAWRVRYFAPAMEVPFCGHATIALGAALARSKGDGVYTLNLNEAVISVEGRRDGDLFTGALQSPPTKSEPADPALVNEILALLGYTSSDLDPRLSPTLANAGATHLILGLRDRAKLAAMDYDLEAGRALMNAAGLVTIALIVTESDRLFHARNAFASGGVLEDPATGAAAAAFAGALRDLGWPHGGAIDIVQGEDMGMRSRLHAEIPSEAGASIRVSGTARLMEA
ncbi:MAG: PhzF family phenazine biosynthesis protein [Pseudomonadota bacterium]